MGRTIIGIGNAIGAGRSKSSGPQPVSDEWLWFEMPDGGTVTLNRTGSPTTVTLEVSLDNGATWSEWAEIGTARTHNLAAGQVMHVRNTSATSTSFSLSNTDYYNFSLSDITYGGGDIRSLLCKIKDNAICTSHCLRNIFRGCTNLKKSPAFGFTELASHCYRNAFQESGIMQSPVLIAVNIPLYAYQNMFSYCYSLKKVTTYMNQVDTISLNNWMISVYDTGDFYCPAELTIPTGASGIPEGWTRHNI